jgi:hypothetical protein
MSRRTLNFAHGELSERVSQSKERPTSNYGSTGFWSGECRPFKERSRLNSPADLLRVATLLTLLFFILFNIWLPSSSSTAKHSSSTASPAPTLRMAYFQNDDAECRSSSPSGLLSEMARSGRWSGRRRARTLPRTG